MKRFTAAIILLAACSAVAIFAATRVSLIPKARTFDFTYHFEIKNLPTGAHNVRVWVPVATSNEHQIVKLEKVSAPGAYHLERGPEYGDRMLYADLRNPHSVEAFTLDYRVTRREYSEGDYASLLKFNSDSGRVPAALSRFLEADRLVPVTGIIKTLAAQVAGAKQGPVAKAHAIYNYIFNTLRYDKSGTGWGRGDAVWACDAKHGNCTDFHSLFIAMMRSQGIPARFVIGFPLPPASAGTIPGYHCWAEFYLKGKGWVPVDISEAWLDKSKYQYYFGTVDDDRVRFSMGRDINLQPRQSGRPVNYFVYPYVEVDGKPFSQIEKKFAFRNVP